MKALTVNQPPKMSSIEIAQLTGKLHKDVLESIRKTLLEVEIEPAEFSARYTDGKGEERPCFNLPRRECDLIIAGYSAKYRLAIIDRWQELEAKTAPRTYIEALQALIETEQARASAVATKGQIGSRREACAMNTASQAVKKVKALEVQLDKARGYCTIKRAEMQCHGQKFDWRLLKAACIDLGLSPVPVFDANYGTVNAYPAEAWLEAYALNLGGAL